MSAKRCSRSAARTKRAAMCCWLCSKRRRTRARRTSCSPFWVGTDVKHLLFSVCLAAAAVAVPASAFADGARFAVIVEGASGDPTYGPLHRGWVDSLADVLRKQFNITGPALSILTETPKDGELRSTAESVKSVFARLAKETKKDDLVFVMLIGHGTADATAAKFNLIGPDLT